MKTALTRLRIAGFKSFAEPVALDILPGLTGIVGPNGCGKSNVVEALRWAMGETSARSLRGGDMDDVIFAGTVARASRNLAEVTVTLEGELPEPYAAEPELAVTRRIERGAGSAFRINGRELRARDVQTLYADLSSGARSSGMVSQGRVAALVGARPEDRRQVLEEAAGITGLHARRHEAELKLRATEQNLARAEDLRTQIEAAREALRKQAKVAARYRNLSGLIRAAEAEHLAILDGQAEAARAAAAVAYAQAAQAAADAAEAVEQAGLALAAAEAAVPAPRAEEAACRSLLERRRLEAETLAAEAARAAEALADAEARSRDIAADLSDAIRARDEAAAIAGRLEAEAVALADRLAQLPATLADAAARNEAAAEAEAAAAHAADQAATAAAHAAAAAGQAAQSRAQAARTLDAAGARLAQCRGDHAALAAQRIDPAVLADAERQAGIAAVAVQDARETLNRAEHALAESNATLATARSAWQQAATEHRSAAERLDHAGRRAAAAGQAVAELAAAAAEADASGIPATQVEAANLAAEAAQAAAAAAERDAIDAEAAARAAEADRLDAATALAAAQAVHARAKELAEAAGRRAATLAAELDEQRARVAEAERARPDPGLLEQAAATAAAAAARLAECQMHLHHAAAARAAAESHLAAVRTEAAAAAAEAQRLAAEADGLRAALAEATPHQFPRAIDSLTVPPGLEAAVAAAMGEAADYALDPAAPRHWSTLPLPAAMPLPPGATALADLIDAPAALSRRLSQTLLIDASEDGAAVQASLRPGQLAVTAAGDAWLWDGQVARAGTHTAAAARLQHRRRLAATAQAAEAATQRSAEASQRAAAADADAQHARAAEADARLTETTAAADLRAAATQRDSRATEAASAQARHQQLLPALAGLEQAHQAATEDWLQSRQQWQSLPDPAASLAAKAAAEARLADALQALDAARAARQGTRDSALKAQDEARRIAAEASAAEQRLSLLAPQLARAGEEHAAALAALRLAESALADLPDPAILQASYDIAGQAAGEAAERAVAARAARDAAERAVAETREHASGLAARHQRIETALSAQATLLAQAEQEAAAAESAVAALEAAAANLPDAGVLATVSVQARAALGEARQRSLRAAAHLQSLQSEATHAHSRQTSLAAELADWRARLADATRRADQLAARAETARQHCLALGAAPADIARRADASGAALAAAGQAHAAAAASLAAAEEAVRTAADARRQADAAAAAASTVLARAEGTRDAAAGALAAVHARIAERLAPQDTPPPAVTDLSDAAEERARRRAERLARERDDMGPVNLRADLELAELDDKAATLEREHAELTTAIAKLRGAIGHLNREGRARLTAVFTEVDRHFRTLFTRVMGGGRAHLAMTGSDDPLLAGLEIYAEPPGKKLATLSLLSGGEQALTALSLIFAVFRCTPAPISVLDEVDAPLDDANVERFCTLLDEMVRDTGTRFLVVTHHQLTMSRMDRLFGVTMQERGVSRLLSVDLQRATALIAEAETLQAAE